MALTASYTNDSDHHSFKHSLNPLPSNLSPKEKSAYFASLRSSVTKLQDEINTLLTTKMEQDKAQSSSDGRSIDDKKEEENYGEEIVDEE